MTTTEPQAQIPQEKAADGSPAGIEEEAITPFPSIPIQARQRMHLPEKKLWYPRQRRS
jgi:hypothetical protein